MASTSVAGLAEQDPLAIVVPSSDSAASISNYFEYADTGQDADAFFESRGTAEHTGDAGPAMPLPGDARVTVLVSPREDPFGRSRSRLRVGAVCGVHARATLFTAATATTP